MSHIITEPFYLTHDDLRKGTLSNGLGLIFGHEIDPDPLDIGKWNVVKASHRANKSKNYIRYEIVASCTSKEAAEAAIRLLSYLEMDYLNA